MIKQISLKGKQPRHSVLHHRVKVKPQYVFTRHKQHSCSQSITPSHPSPHPIHQPTQSINQERVSFLSLAQDPKLAEAARAEVHRQQSNEHLDHDAGHLPDHHLDVPPPDSTTVLQGLHSLILSEYHLNKSLADGLGVRLEASKTSIEKLLALLQAVTTAESAYAQAMSKAALVDVRSADDGEGLQSAVGGFGHLLGLIGQAHTQVYEGLSEATKSVQASVGALRSSCNAIQSSHASAARGVEEAQGRIRQAKQAHSDAVKYVFLGRGCGLVHVWVVCFVWVVFLCFFVCVWCVWRDC